MGGRCPVSPFDDIDDGILLGTNLFPHPVINAFPGRFDGPCPGLMHDIMMVFAVFPFGSFDHPSHMLRCHADGDLMNFNGISVHDKSAMWLLAVSPYAVVTVLCNRKGIHVMKSGIRIIRLLKDKSRPCIANSQTSHLRIKRSAHFLLRGAGKAGQGFTANHHSPFNKPGLQVGIHDIKGGEHPGAGVGLVKDNRIAKIKITGKRGGGGGFKTGLPVRAVVAGDIGADDQVDILRLIFGDLKAPGCCFPG